MPPAIEPMIRKKVVVQILRIMEAVRSLESVNDRIDFWLFQLPANYRYSIENLTLGLL